MMGVEDMRQGPALLFQRLDNRVCVGRVHDPHLSLIGFAKNIDVIIGTRRYLYDL